MPPTTPTPEEIKARILELSRMSLAELRELRRQNEPAPPAPPKAKPDA